MRAARQGDNAMHRTLVATDEGFEAVRRGEPLEPNKYTGTDLARFYETGHRSGVEIRELERIEWPPLRRNQARQAA